MERFFMGGVLIILGGLMLVLWWQENETLRKLDDESVTTNATIVGHYSYQDCSTDDEGYESCKTKYRIQYRFRASNERTYERTADVSLSVYSRYAIEDSILIQYLPSNPDTSRLAEEDEEATIAQWGLFGGGAAIAAGLFVMFARQR